METKIKVFLIVGARPNFMKIAPVYFKMKDTHIFDPMIVHTGQHYDENMSKIFFDDLDLPEPDIFLGVGSGSHAAQTAQIMVKFEQELLIHQPEIVVVVGDVNSTIACALTAIKVHLPESNIFELRRKFNDYIGKRETDCQVSKFHRLKLSLTESPLIVHIEAGERSFDMSMPEEVNRIGTDIYSDILFTTSEESDHQLIAEGVDPRKIFRVGNIMIDSLKAMMTKSKTSAIIQSLNDKYSKKIEKKRFALVTLHRAGNVDSKVSLTTLFNALIKISEFLPIVFPLHPRTRKLVNELSQSIRSAINSSNIILTEPVGYLDFLYLQSQARLILTDSGGIQVESSYLGIPCLTLRETTEWRITMERGTNRLIRVNEDAIVKGVQEIMQSPRKIQANIPLWDGSTAERIVRVLKEIL